MRKICESLTMVASKHWTPCRAYRVPGRLLAAAARLVAVLCLAVVALQVQADDGLFADYHLGEGLRLGNSGVSLGGYATASYSDLTNASSPRVGFDNLSLFVWWQGEGRWKFFSELDYENVWASNSHGQEGDDRYLALERLYLDYDINELATVRAGKFLTPIGRWNLIHATPLVWTTTRPLVTTRTFPTNVTGLMLYGTLPAVADGMEYTLYASKGDEIRPNPVLDPFYEVYGAHAILPMPLNGQLGISLADFEQEDSRDEKRRLVGLDYFWSRNRYEFSAEGVYRFSENGNLWDEKGAFGQLVIPLSERAYAVGRYEYYHPALETRATQLFVLGLNYRITPAIVLKAEWDSARNNNIGAPEGFLSSLCILF